MWKTEEQILNAGETIHFNTHTYYLKGILLIELSNQRFQVSLICTHT